MAVRVPMLSRRGDQGKRWATRETDARRYRAKPWRKWYALKVWKTRRAEQLQREPLCRMCAEANIIREANIADHVIPHRGDWDLFVGGLLQSLCVDCHNVRKQREEALAVRAGGGGGV